MRYNLTIAILLFVVLAAVPAQAEQRCVLVEYFTSVTCAPCTTGWVVLDTLAQFYSADSLAIIRYFPEPGDPFYQPESFSINGYYGVWLYPHIFFDGTGSLRGAHSERYPDSIEVHLTIPSPLDLNLAVSYDTLTREGTAQCCVMATDSVGGTDLYLRYVLIESELPYDGVVHNQVLRDAFPSALGNPIEIGQGQTCGDTVTFALDSLWQPENCELVAFIQDHPTKEVLQSIRKPIYESQAPAAVENLELSKAGTFIHLSWSAVAKDNRGYLQPVDHYRIYRDTSRTYHPEALVLLDSTTDVSYTDDAAGHIGDTGANAFYIVTAVASGVESDPSVAVGEVDKYVTRTK